MTALELTGDEHVPDTDLWQSVRQGSVPAFEALVRRHQSAVCAVAYNACGNLTLSEDVAQETFWAAWRGRETLADPGRLRPWLCGIARNLGKNALRRDARAARSAVTLDAAADMSAAGPDPVAEAMSREEEALVWQTLEQIPEAYREPLVLFYREQQSVAEVAEALDLSEDAVKQRLSRGRGLLRHRVSELVEGWLRRSRPDRGLTVAVMAGLIASSVGSSTAWAGTGAVATGTAGPALKAAAGTGLSGAVLGGGLGSLIGMAGGWFGTWLPAQLAATKRERDYLQRTARRMLLVSILFTAALVVLPLAFADRYPFVPYLLFWSVWMVAFGAYVTTESVCAARELRRLRTEAVSAPNDSPLRAGLTELTARFRGRVFRSRVTFLGLPLLEVNVSDPAPSGRTGRLGERRVARGWIAVGDDARGILLAVGGTARGMVAIGGRSVGMVSVGGLAVGLVAIGGIALGGLAVGGIGIGVFGIGGLGIGWQSAGGGAVAWDTACGGGAVAWQAAYGGGAIAHEYAVGGEALAMHANDDAAKAYLLSHPLKQGVEWYTANSTWPTTGIVVLAVLLPCLLLPMMYRHERIRERHGC